MVSWSWRLCLAVTLVVLAFGSTPVAATPVLAQPVVQKLHIDAHLLAQPEPTQQPAVENRTVRGAENNPFEQIAAVGMLVVVAIAVVLHRASLRRRSSARPRPGHDGP
jgi:hypothetical protein